MAYDPVVILLAVIAAGAVFLGIGIYVRNGSGGRAAPALGAIWAIVLILPVLAGMGYFVAGVGRRAPESTRYATFVRSPSGPVDAEP